MRYIRIVATPPGEAPGAARTSRGVTFDNHDKRNLRVAPRAGVGLACLETRARRTDDGIDILPVGEFLRRLWAGELLEA